MVKIKFTKKEHFDVAIKKFRKLVNDAEIIKDYKKNLFYKKPNVKKKIKKLNRIKSLQKINRKNYFLKKKW